MGGDKVVICWRGGNLGAGSGISLRTNDRRRTMGKLVLAVGTVALLAASQVSAECKPEDIWENVIEAGPRLGHRFVAEYGPETFVGKWLSQDENREKYGGRPGTGVLRVYTGSAGKIIILQEKGGEPPCWSGSWTADKRKYEAAVAASEELGTSTDEQ
jgi:hypothetical protein